MRTNLQPEIATPTEAAVPLRLMVIKTTKTSFSSASQYGETYNFSQNAKLFEKRSLL